MNTLHRLLHRRTYATKYTAKITTTQPSNHSPHSFSVELNLPHLQQTLDPKGYPLPRRHLICKAVNIISSSTSPHPFTELDHYLQTLTLPLTISEASDILKSLPSVPLALQFFRFCHTSVPNFRHDCFTYNRIILILSKSNLPDRVESVSGIVDEMERLGVRGNISTVNLLIRMACGGEDMERCLGLAGRWEVKMNRFTYKCVLQWWLRARDTEKAVEVYGEMRRKGYWPDVFAFNMLIDALAKDDKVDQANKVFKDMKKNHCEPDEYTYTILIRMTGKHGKPDESIGLFQEMVSKNIAPNLIAYNTVIQVLAVSKRVDKTIYLFSKMIENGCRPNEFTYSIILNLLILEGQLGRLDEVVEMSKTYMNKGIYAYLVRTLSKLGHASEAHRLFCYMWNFHDRGDRDAYLSMLESLCNEGKMVEAIDLLSKIHEKGISSDTIMYNTVFTALGKLKQIAHLVDLYEKMKKEGPLPDIFTYNILISSFGRAGKVDEAVNIFDELENSDCKPDIVSYNSLINCLGKNGDVDEAHMRFREMEEKGLNPDVVTYSTLIECFGKSDKVEMACRLFDEMLSVGCCPNIVTYNILLDCLERCGRTGEAVDLYAKLKEQGLTPDSITYSILERLQSDSHRKFRIRRQHPITGWVVSPLR